MKVKVLLIMIIISFISIYGYSYYQHHKVLEFKKQNIQLDTINERLATELAYYQSLFVSHLPKCYPNPIHLDDYSHLTSPYGLRDIPDKIYTGGSKTRFHEGIDLTGTYQARIIAVSDGEVVDHYLPTGWHGRVYYKGHPVLGGMIKIKHTDGKYSVYGHLSKTYVNETNKRYVKKGQVIGRMGDTGMSTGPHLHFELQDPFCQTLQPLKYLKIVDRD